MELKQQLDRIMTCIAGAALVGVLLQGMNLHHIRTMQRMAYCASNGGTTNLAGECLPGTGRGQGR